MERVLTPEQHAALDRINRKAKVAGWDDERHGPVLKLNDRARCVLEPDGELAVVPE